jgi:NAD-dependent SIR2 family protein deacetylase
VPAGELTKLHESNGARRKDVYVTMRTNQPDLQCNVCCRLFHPAYLQVKDALLPSCPYCGAHYRPHASAHTGLPPTRYCVPRMNADC